MTSTSRGRSGYRTPQRHAKGPAGKPDWLSDMTPEPQLDMLWESVDPAAALTTRFGFPDARGAAGWIAETLEEAWALHVESCDRLVISASKLLLWLTVDQKRVIAKCAVDPTLFVKLAEVDALTAWLEGEGIPVAAPIAATDGRLRVERGGSSLGLYPVVSGELLEVDDANQVETAGRMLATLHQGLAAYPLPFAGERPLAGQQLVHGDFRSANILHDGAGITAILDLDEASYRSRAAELAQSAVLLGTRYHHWRPTSPAARQVYVSAYNEVSPLTRAQRDEYDRGVTAVSKHFGWT